MSTNAQRGMEQSRADDLVAVGHILIYLMRGGHLPWDMDPLPELVVDDKDPLIYKKTMQHQKDQRDWSRRYLDLKV